MSSCNAPTISIKSKNFNIFFFSRSRPLKSRKKKKRECTLPNWLVYGTLTNLINFGDFMSNKCRYPSQLTKSSLLLKWTLFVFTVIYSSKRASLLNRNFFSKCSRSRSFSLFPERGLCLRVAVVVLVEVVVSTLQGASLLRGFYFFSLKFR